MDARHLASSLLIHTIRWTGTEIVLDASGTTGQGICPTCGVGSSYIHDRYVRRPRDLPWRGRRVRLNLVVRRFRCQNATCPRRTFAEDFGPALGRYAHFTTDERRYARASAAPLGGCTSGDSARARGR